MKQMVTSPPVNVVYLGWNGHRCLKQFDVIPEAAGTDEDGSANFLLSDIQSCFRLKTGTEAYDVMHQRLSSAADHRQQMTVTVDMATNDILAVA